MAGDEMVAPGEQATGKASQDSSGEGPWSAELAQDTQDGVFGEVELSCIGQHHAIAQVGRGARRETEMAVRIASEHKSDEAVAQMADAIEQDDRMGRHYNPSAARMAGVSL